MDYTPLYISTFALVMFCIILLYTVHKIIKLKIYVQEIEILHTQRYNKLEQLIKTDVTDILNILKNQYDQNINLDKKQ